MNKTPRRMLQAMDHALKWWRLPAVGRDKGRVIRRLIERHRSRRAVEIGSLFGYSAVLIGASLPAGGRLTCIEANEFLAEVVRRNADAAGLGSRVSVTVGDALRVLPLLRTRFDFALIDAAKEDYLEYLRSLEPKLARGAVVVADNTGIYRRQVKPYLDYVRGSGRYQNREYEFGGDCMEVSILS
jgi:predicted O-methyltransferase YrrM